MAEREETPQIPTSFISSLNEHTTGGYFILYFDLEGNPRIQCEFDNSAYSLGAQKHIEHWLQAASICQKRAFVQALSANPSGDDGDDDEPA